MNRLFVALNIPSTIRRDIVNYRDILLPGSYGQHKWEPEDKIHLTLKFIGEVRDELTEPITGALNFLRETSKFECSFASFGFFFREKESKILWLDLRFNPGIVPLVMQINKELSKFGIPVERRKFMPHLTLLRIKRNFPEEMIDRIVKLPAPQISFTADEITLYKSELLPEGSKYTAVKRFNLI